MNLKIAYLHIKKKKLKPTKLKDFEICSSVKLAR